MCGSQPGARLVHGEEWGCCLVKLSNRLAPCTRCGTPLPPPHDMCSAASRLLFRCLVSQFHTALRRSPTEGLPIVQNGQPPSRTAQGCSGLAHARVCFLCLQVFVYFGIASSLPPKCMEHLWTAFGMVLLRKQSDLVSLFVHDENSRRCNPSICPLSRAAVIGPLAEQVTPRERKPD